MEDYIFHEGQLPDGYEPNFDPALFNQPQHLYLQSSSGWTAFYVLHKKYGHISAAIYIHREEGVARSPFKSPFGSFEISPSLPHKVLFAFLEYIESRLKAHGVKEIVIKTPPPIYQPDSSALIHTFLFNQGYQVIDAEVGAVISVTENTYECYPDAWERRKLRQAYEAGLRFKELSPDQLSEAYIFILACRKQRGHTLSMSLSDLKSAVDNFPNRYLIFGVLEGERLAGASIAIRVRDHILYNFYTAHPKDFDHVSPVVMLVEGLYGYCQRNNIGHLDLGTSAVDKKPNFGLLDFKLRLGAQATSKLTLGKKLN